MAERRNPEHPQKDNEIKVLFIIIKTFNLNKCFLANQLHYFYMKIVND